MSIKNPNRKLSVATDMQIENALRQAYGHRAYDAMKVKRRLKCSKCPKTWKFNDKLLHTICPRCKEGRLS